MRNRKIRGVSGLAVPAPLRTTGREKPVKMLGFGEDGEGVRGLHILYLLGVYQGYISFLMQLYHTTGEGGNLSQKGKQIMKKL